jgi:FAD-dependent urate hydroxylase
MSPTEVLIIGAGPFGLSLSAHLRALGVEHRIVGRPLDTWHAHMPEGMFLRSEPYGSDMASPQRGWDVEAYCKAHGLTDYVARLGPLSLERFLAYGDWYVSKLVPDVLDYTVTQLTRVSGGFLVSFEEAESLLARFVVVATGVRPYAHIPGELRGLPSDVVSHTIDHSKLSAFKGRRVAVVGIGQSATETAAILHEEGAEVQMIGRQERINFLDPNPAKLGPFGQVRRPVNKLCEGWHCTFWNTPALYNTLPLRMKMDKTKTVLGPAASWWLKDRVDGKIEVLGNTRVRSATPQGSGLRLSLDGPGLDVLDVDHVIAGTGYRMDLARLSFLPEEIRVKMWTVNGYPIVDRVGESTAPGVYFMGAPSAFSLGPSVRFIAGTHNVAAKLAKSLAQRSRASAGRLEAPSVVTAPDGVTA